MVKAKKVITISKETMKLLGFLMLFFIPAMQAQELTNALNTLNKHLQHLNTIITQYTTQQQVDYFIENKLKTQKHLPKKELRSILNAFYSYAQAFSLLSKKGRFIMERVTPYYQYWIYRSYLQMFVNYKSFYDITKLLKKVNVNNFNDLYNKIQEGYEEFQELDFGDPYKDTIAQQVDTWLSFFDLIGTIKSNKNPSLHEISDYYERLKKYSKADMINNFLYNYWFNRIPVTAVKDTESLNTLLKEPEFPENPDEIIDDIEKNIKEMKRLHNETTTLDPDYEDIVEQAQKTIAQYKQQQK